MDNEHGLPLGLCKQAAMKLDAFMSDIHEIAEDEDLSPEHKLLFTQIGEMSGNMLAAIINTVAQEMDETEFIAETIGMDEIPEYPEDTTDLMDTEIE